MTPTTSDPERTALTAALTAGHPALARSHRLHRRRGGFCARGWCQQCPLETAEGVALACRSPAGATPRLGLDPIRALGLVGERVPPWFYERRFRRPRALRQTYLRFLRRLSSAPTLPEPPAPVGPGSAEDVETDVLVVGGGPSGVAAGAALAEAGSRVAVIALGRLGGSAPLAGEVASATARDVERIERSGARILTDTLCLGLYEEEGVVAALGPSGPFVVRFERLVVATGAYDRLPLVPGNDLPGVVGLRAFERLARQGAFGAGIRVGACGGPAELERAIAAADRFRVPLAWAVELGGGERLERIGGRRRVRGARFAVRGRRRCDVLVVGLTQPMFELQLHAGCEAIVEGSPPVVRTRGSARVPMLVVGEAAGQVDPEGALGSAYAAASAWTSGSQAPTEGTSADLGASAPPSAGAFVCLCEDVRVRDVAAAVAEGFGDLELLKRRTGATTGPCQGKLCLPLFCEAAASMGVRASIPTARPPLRPVSISSLGAEP